MFMTSDAKLQLLSVDITIYIFFLCLVRVFLSTLTWSHISHELFSYIIVSDFLFHIVEVKQL
jgi:hypothetical protein